MFNINGPESLFRGLGARALSLVGGLDGLSDMLAEVRQLLQKKKTNLTIRKSWRIEPSENKERMKKEEEKKKGMQGVCGVLSKSSEFADTEPQ